MNRIRPTKDFRAWSLYLSLGVLATGVYFLLSPEATNVLLDVVGISAVAAILVGIRLNRPARLLPWRLFAVGLILFVAGDVTSTVYENVLGIESPFPSVADVFYLAVYPILVIGLLMIRNPRLGRRGASGLIDPTVVATGAGLLFWVYFMEPYGNAQLLTLLQGLIGVAYPLMDLLLFVVVIRLLLVSGERPPAYYLLCASLGFLLLSDIVYTVMAATDNYQPGDPIDATFLLFFTFFGAAALHPSMNDLFEPGPRLEARLTRWRLALLAGASLMAPGMLALQEARGQPINVPLIVGGSVVLFLLVVARMAGMMRARERAVDREKILRQAGADLVAAPDRENLYKVSLDAVLDLSKEDPNVQASLWVGSEAEMSVVAAVGDHAGGYASGAEISLVDPPDSVQSSLPDQRLAEVEQTADIALLHKALGYYAEARDVFVTPLRIREELVGAIVVASDAFLPGENRDALETLGVEVALALENVQSKEQLAHQAFHDPLTNLPNRALFMNRLEGALARIERRRESVAVLFLDLDGFKPINDSLGHDTGDRLLISVAERIQASMRAGDTAARLGGDEFIILLEDISDTSDVIRVAERIARELQAPLTIGEHEISITASIGIAVSTSGKDRPNDLLNHADAAMYRAKEQGSAQHQIFEART